MLIWLMQQLHHLNNSCLLRLVFFFDVSYQLMHNGSVLWLTYTISWRDRFPCLSSLCSEWPLKSLPRWLGSPPGQFVIGIQAWLWVMSSTLLRDVLAAERRRWWGTFMSWILFGSKSKFQFSDGGKMAICDNTV